MVTMVVEYKISANDSDSVIELSTEHLCIDIMSVSSSPPSQSISLTFIVRAYGPFPDGLFCGSDITASPMAEAVLV